VNSTTSTEGERQPETTFWGVMLRRLLVGCVLLGPGIWMFRAALFQGESFSFRDGAHYYLPLYTWMAEQRSEGDWPLWNPHENLGYPLAGDPTAAMFYPGHLIFHIGFNPMFAYCLYVVGHVWLAAGLAYWAAKRWGGSDSAALLAGLCFAYGGSVLMQYCNVVYLVGAAWLPLALLAGEHALRLKSWRWAMAAAAGLALIVLGGDPQTGYHAGIALAGYAVLLCLRQQKTWMPRFGLLGLMAVVSLLLAMVQILPSWEWGQHSDRAAYSAPRNLYESAALVTQSGGEVETDDSQAPWPLVMEGLFSHPRENSHQEHIYNFSVGPWHAASLLWPNVAGKPFPTNQRWSSVLPAEGESWTPTLYIGLFPVLLAFSVWTLRSRNDRSQDDRIRWLSYLALLSALAALGWYGLGWLAMELESACGGNPHDGFWGAPVGGLYWLLVTVLPGYANFRFPAKWLTMMSFALSMLAAIGWQRCWDDVQEDIRSRLPQKLTTAALVIAAISLVGALLAALTIPALIADSAFPENALFGPLDRNAIPRALAFTMLHTAVVAGAIAGLLIASRRLHAKFSSRLSCVGIAIVAIELVVANSWVVVTAPVENWDITSQMQHEGRLFRAASYGWSPPQFQQTSSEERLKEALNWDRETLFPKYPLMANRGVVEVSGSGSSFDFVMLMFVSRQHGVLRPDRLTGEPHPHLLAAMNARYLMLPAGMKYDDTKKLETSALHGGLFRNDAAFERAWVVRHVDEVVELDRRRPDDVLGRTEEAFLVSDGLRDLSKSTLLEFAVDAREKRPDLKSTATSDSSVDDVAIVKSDNCEVELDAKLATGGLLILSDHHYPGWKAEIVSDGKPPELLEIHRVNRIMRGVYLPSGEHRIRYTYKPWWAPIGTFTSIVAWLCVFGALLLTYRRARKKINPTSNSN